MHKASPRDTRSASPADEELAACRAPSSPPGVINSRLSASKSPTSPRRDESGPSPTDAKLRAPEDEPLRRSASRGATAAVGSRGRGALTVHIPMDRSLGDSQEVFNNFHAFCSASQDTNEIVVVNDAPPPYPFPAHRRATLPPTDGRSSDERDAIVSSSTAAPASDDHKLIFSSNANLLEGGHRQFMTHEADANCADPLVPTLAIPLSHQSLLQHQQLHQRDASAGVLASAPRCIIALSTPTNDPWHPDHSLQHGSTISTLTSPLGAAPFRLHDPLRTPVGAVPSLAPAPSSTHDTGLELSGQLSSAAYGSSSPSSALPTPQQRPVASFRLQRDAIDEVIHGVLYIGGARGAQNVAALEDLGITAFLNVAVDVPMPEHVLARAPGPSTVLPGELAASVVAAGGRCGGSGVVEYLHLPLRDKGDTVLAEHFAAAFGFIRGCARERRRVLLFCREGKSRSGSIAIAFLMEERAMSYEAALEYVRRCRSSVDPNLSFCSQLSSSDVVADLRPRQS